MARITFRTLRLLCCGALTLGVPGIGGPGLVGPAFGADLPLKAPLFKATGTYSWTGFYAGANAGYGVGQSQGSYTSLIGGGPATTQTFNAIPGGGFGGGQIGFNYQYRGFVLGVESDIQGAGIADTRTCLGTCAGATAALINQKLDWFGTTRARLGLASGPVLTYVTGGAAYGETETGVATGPTVTSTKTGWTWGTGVEAALGGNWTAKMEYLYIDLGSAAATAPGATFNTKTQDQLFRGGINYRFGPAQPAGVGPMSYWSGLFVGGTIGAAIGRDDSRFTVPRVGTESFNLSPRGIAGGGIVGYNWQFGSWVPGVEADFQDSFGSGYLTCAMCTTANPTAIDQNLQWFGTVRARLGYTVGPALFYATGGLAYGSVKDSLFQTAGAVTTNPSFSHGKTGYAVGGGIENKLDFFGLLGPRWSTRSEYLYVDLGSVSDTFTNPASLAGANPQTLTSKLHEQIFRTVVSYRFGG